MSDMDQRHRVVVMGAGGVGKSSIIKRFLCDSFTEEYTETVEDLYCREFEVNASLIKVDILDTAGNIAFPAMRRLSISNAHAFVLVYSITSEASFGEVKRLWAQIREQRRDYDRLPCVVVGSKLDMENERRVEKFEALDWAVGDGLQGRFVEVSAKSDESIGDVFRILLHQANIPAVRHLDVPFRRRLSFDHPPEDSAKNEDRKKFLRSRSLIRRGSRPKIKRSGNPARNDCHIS